MRNKITIHFNSIDLNSAKTFYNIIREKANEQINGYIEQLQFQLDCNILEKRIIKHIICSICNETFKRIYTPSKLNALLYQHDCKIYEQLYDQKKIINIEVV